MYYPSGPRLGNRAAILVLRRVGGRGFTIGILAAKLLVVSAAKVSAAKVLVVLAAIGHSQLV